MQLTAARRARPRRRPPIVWVAAAFAFAATPERTARATAPADTATESAATEFATYVDSDHVTVFTPSIRLGVENAAGASLTATYLADVVSAASVDVVSTASSRWRELRHAGTLSGQYKPRDFGVALGSSVSSEPDYFSYGVSANIIKDFNEKNWTLTFGYGFSHDTAGRCAGPGSCTPFSVFSRDLDRGTLSGSLGWVIDRTSLASLGIDVVLENGDQSSPYRYIPMFSAAVAPTIERGASIAVVNAERLPERPLEQLPLSRQRVALMGSYAHRFDTSTLRVDERVYDDSWGQLASSTDAKWIFDLGSRFAFWPHARWHAQSAVSFWQRAYVSGMATGWELPEFRTINRELGPLWIAQGGLGFRWFLGKASDPRTLALGATADLMYTSFLDDLFLLYRIGGIGAVTLETQW